MKKIILFLSFIFVVFSAFSQERTVNKNVREGFTYYKYTGSASDVLTSTTQDTIDIVFRFTVNETIKKVSVKSKFDPVLGADTTVAISVDAKNFADGSYTNIITSTLSDAVTVDNIVKVLNTTYTLGVAAFDIPFTNPTAGTADTLEVPAQTYTPDDYSYRYYRVRYIIKGDDSVGTGIEIDEVEFKIFTE